MLALRLSLIYAVLANEIRDKKAAISKVNIIKEGVRLGNSSYEDFNITPSIIESLIVATDTKNISNFYYSTNVTEVNELSEDNISIPENQLSFTYDDKSSEINNVTFKVTSISVTERVLKILDSSENSNKTNNSHEKRKSPNQKYMAINIISSSMKGNCTQNHKESSFQCQNELNIVRNGSKYRKTTISSEKINLNMPSLITKKGTIQDKKAITSVNKSVRNSDSIHNVRYIIPNKLKRHSYSYNIGIKYPPTTQNKITSTATAAPTVKTDGRVSKAAMYITSTSKTAIDENSPSNVTVQLGSTAYLPCKINNLGNKTVSWIRNRDSHILTVDRYIFIADERFQAWHNKKSGTWTLMVKYVQERDDGRYECQVSSEPKISHFVYFEVVSPRVQITGGSDIYVKMGTSISLTCIISNVLKQPEYVFWYQDNRRVVSRGNKKTGNLLEEGVNSTTISTLGIPHASVHDAGVYQCSPERLNRAKVTLHVINGEHPAAIQLGTSVMTSSISPELLALVLVLPLIADLIQ